MADATTIVAGIPIPSTSPMFLAGVGVHVLLGMACIVTGAVAMFSRKGRGRHSRFGTIYFWCLAAVFATSTALAVVRWAEDSHLFALGAAAFSAAVVGRTAARRGAPGWPRLHVVGMGASYVLLFTAFYVDNGKSLPVWRDLSPITYWLAPAAVGAPVIAWALLRHPIIRRGGQVSD